MEVLQAHNGSRSGELAACGGRAVTGKRSALGASAVLAGLLSGASAGATDLMEVYQLALDNDPTYSAGVHQFEASYQLLNQTRASLLPSLSFNASYVNTEQNIVSSDNEVFAAGRTSFDTTDLTLSLNQSIFNFSNWARLRQAKAQRSQLDAEFQAVRQDLLLRVAEAYFGALAVYEDLQSVEAEERAVMAQARLVSVQREKGLVRQTDLLDAQARHMQVQARAVEIRSRARDAMQELVEITGGEPQALASLRDAFSMESPTPGDPQRWVQRATEFNPELLIRKHAVEVAQREVYARRGDRYPSIDLQLNYNDNDTGGTLFGGGSEVETQDIRLSVNVPLYNGGRTTARVKEAVSLLRRVKDELTLEQRGVQRAAYAAFDGIMTDLTKARALARSVQAYESSVLVKRTGFESGTASNLTVLDAERELFFARSEYAQARYGYVLNMLRLKRAVGVLQESDLAELNNALSDTETVSVVSVGFPARPVGAASSAALE